MADRNFYRDQYTNEANVTRIYCKVTAAADVAADGYTVAAGSGYVSSVTRTAEGTFTLDLADAYPAFLGVHATISKADTTIQFSAEDVAGTTPTVTLKTITAGSAADPDSATMYFELVLRNSSVS